MLFAPRSQIDSEHAARQLAIDLEAAQAACAGGDHGSVMRGLYLCAVHRQAVPDWLRAAFILQYSLVSDAQVASWDDAFGRPWKKGTRLHAKRERMQLLKAVHTKAWELLQADLGRAITRALFDEVGESTGIHCCGSKAERIYYEAVQQGYLNLSVWRKSELAGDSESSADPEI